MKPHKIFIVFDPAPMWGIGSLHGMALAEDGTGLCGHLSSNLGFGMHDMGLTSNWKHDVYKKHYPDGYELEYVTNPDEHEGFQKAYELNKAKNHERR